jgi:signal transduction histidine kinase
LATLILYQSHRANQATAELRKVVPRLAQADVRKSSFLAELAHEVRGPLSAMKLATGLLSRSALDARQVRAIATLERQVEQMARLTGDLMDASQIQAGKVQLQRVRVRAAAVLTQAIEAVRSTTDARGQEIAVEGAGELWLDVDPTRTVQIVSNLLHNASKFSPEGSRILVRLALQDSLVCIRVSDAGVGIPADKLEWVFDTYAQMKPGGSGLGLGLSLVRRLVELHGGRIQAFSDGPGQGSTFAAWLPAADGESPQPASLAGAEASAASV